MKRINSSKLQIVWQGQTALGEGPLWHPQEKVLYFIDLRKKTLERLDPITGAHMVWQMPDFIGSVVARKQGGLLATVGQSVMVVEMPEGRLTPLVKVIPDHRPDLRMNDGKVDRKGRFWFGVANLDVANPQGGLFRLDVDHTVTPMESGITISNGLGFSPDDCTFYYTDGLKYRIYAYDFDLAHGKLSNRRIFLQLPPSKIEPDGLTVDCSGYLWEAAWESSAVVRYAPNGEIDTVIELPVARPTSCILGGENLDVLYITTASQGLNETKALPAPAGAIFAIKVDVPGLPEPYYLG